jgi:hypothetical protein
MLAGQYPARSVQPAGADPRSDCKHRVYAYLRYSVGGRTVSTHIGEATGATRAEGLRHAWTLGRRRGLI